MDFVPAANAWRKLQLAHGLKAAVYMYAATGYGKTSLVKHFTEGRKSVWFSCRELLDSAMLAIPQNQDKREPLCVVIDDLHILQDEDIQEEILKLMSRPDLWLVIIGRMPTPGWLMPLISSMQMVIIKEEELRLSTEEIRRICEQNGLHFTEEELNFFADNGEGNAMALMATLQYLDRDAHVTQSLVDQMAVLFGDYLERYVIPQWSTILQDFLMQVSVVDEFTLPLAEAITGDDHAAQTLRTACETGNFMIREGDIYRIRRVLLNTLRERADKKIGRRQINRYIYNAAHYYELRDDVPRALRLYEQCGEKENIRSLLIKNGRRNPGAGCYYELRRYYLALKPEEVEDSPVLLAALSMLHSMLMDAEQSEYWYEKLKQFAARSRGGERQEAMAQILYLDIGLPHRGSVNLVEILKNVPAALLQNGCRLPEFSVTSNLPSTMNGGKDFCEWSKRDQLLADSIGKMVEKLLGRAGCGLVNAALAESFFEKGMDDYTVMSLLTRSQAESEARDAIEMTFVSVGLQVRLSMKVGNCANALNLLDSFETAARRGSGQRLLRNIAALRCRVYLMQGEMKQAEAWMETAPNELTEFNTMERFEYLTKIRCYLAKGLNYEALALLERMRIYAERSQRTYIRMETDMLSAVARHRLGTEWKEEFLKMLHKASEYKFIRLIAEEGAAVLPLLRKVRLTYLAEEGADADWFERMMAETERMQFRYPKYLVGNGISASDFGETALAVLRMQASGMNMRQIAEKLHISERTAKYHASENYRKLGAKGKTDAVQIAGTLNLL